MVFNEVKFVKLDCYIHPHPPQAIPFPTKELVQHAAAHLYQLLSLDRGSRFLGPLQYQETTTRHSRVLAFISNNMQFTVHQVAQAAFATAPIDCLARLKQVLAWLVMEGNREGRATAAVWAVL